MVVNVVRAGMILLSQTGLALTHVLTIYIQWIVISGFLVVEISDGCKVPAG